MSHFSSPIGFLQMCFVVAIWQILHWSFPVFVVRCAFRCKILHLPCGHGLLLCFCSNSKPTWPQRWACFCLFKWSTAWVWFFLECLNKIVSYTQSKNFYAGKPVAVTSNRGAGKVLHRPGTNPQLEQQYYQWKQSHPNSGEDVKKIVFTV